MMDNKDVEAEIHPLKNEDRKSQESFGNRLKNEDNLKSMPAQSRLSRCRTVAFFLSLFICLFVVFVVSFIIPCPDRPVSQRMWKIDYNAAVTYDFLAMEDINRDKIQDVVFLYKNTNSSNNSNLSCADEGFSSPCAFVAAVSGANGSVLWERPVVQDVAFVECTTPQPSDHKVSSACILVGRPGSFLAVDLFTGETLWSHPSSFGGNTSILTPLLQVPDIDSDGAPDLLILTQEGKEVSVYIYSGSTGDQIGHRSSLGVDGVSGPLLHVTRTGAHYILLPCASSLCGCSLKGLYKKVTGRDGPFKSDPHWENMLNASTHRLLPSSGAVRYLMNVPGKAGQDVLLVSSQDCVLLDGQELTPRWTLGAAQVLRKPILGHYKPDTPAVVIENGTGINRQILLLDLSSGAILWSQTLPSFPGAPPPNSLPTADHRSAFFFWGLHELIGTNETDPRDARHSLYMFHPTLPSVLLELANVSANIIAFDVLLADKEGGPAPMDEALDEAVPEYQAPGKRSMLEIQRLDPEDESLAKYKQALLGPLPSLMDPSLPNVQVTRLTLMSEQAPGPITMDLTGDLAALKSQVFVLKEGVDYQVKVTFKVNKEIVSGLKCLHHTYRGGLRVDKAVYMVGSYGPRAQEYEFVTPVEEAPRGMLVRGPYVVRSLFTDDDRTNHLSWEWGLHICQDWKD